MVAVVKFYSLEPPHLHAENSWDFFSHHFLTEILSIILNVKYMWLLTFTLTCLYFSFRKNNPRFLTVLPKYQKNTLVQKQEAALR